MPDYTLVDMAVDDTIVDLVASADRIGVDTEFMREKTYFAELCLLQVSAGETLVCADPLPASAEPTAVTTSSWQALMRPEWVLHSARQDMEVVIQSCGTLPAAVFDTQIAAALLGSQPQLGYAALVQDLFGVELPKSHTRANWTRRPLADELLQYAAEDVEYLLPAYDELKSRLQKAGRFEWAIEDSRDLLNPALYATDPLQAIDRLKGARNLRGRARAAAIRLAAWRETEAIRSNRPRQWILRDQVLIDLAVQDPATTQALATIDGLPESTRRKTGDAILAALHAAGDDDQQYVPPERPDEQAKKLLKRLQKEVAAAASRLGLAAEIIAPRKELADALRGETDSRVFSGWRRELVGEQLLALLAEG